LDRTIGEMSYSVSCTTSDSYILHSGWKCWNVGLTIAVGSPSDDVAIGAES
jgi:hypothetical protein